MTIISPSSKNGFAKNVALLMWLYNDSLEVWYNAKINGSFLSESKKLTKEIWLSMNAQENIFPVILDCL